MKKSGSVFVSALTLALLCLAPPPFRAEEAVPARPVRGDSHLHIPTAPIQTIPTAPTVPAHPDSAHGEASSAPAAPAVPASPSPSASDAPAKRVKPAEVRGVWIYDPRVLDAEETIRDLKAHGFNRVFVRLSSGGAAYYPSKVMPMVPGCEDNARLWERAAHRHGMEIHAWHVCFMMHNAPQESINRVLELGEAMEDDRGRVIRPSYNAPVRSPAAESTVEFEKRAMVELATRYKLDGVQFDYIRYPSTEVDYSPASRRKFMSEEGAVVKNWPWDLSEGRRAAEFHDWKVRQITSVVRRVSTAVRQANPNIQISAAVWYDPEIGRNDFCQDWPAWVKKGYVDFVCPMSYTTDADNVRKWTRIQKKAVGGRVPIYPGLGAYMLKRPNQLNRQVAILRAAGMPGFVLYNYDEKLSKVFLPNLD